MKKLLLSALCAVGFVFSANAVNVTDELTNTVVGMGGKSVSSYSTYADVAAKSDARYTFVCAGTDNTIQFRYNTSSGKEAGMFTTVSGGKAVSVKITWNTKTYGDDASKPREFYVYGKNTAYSAITDIMTANVTEETRGTQIGYVKYDKENLVNEITLEGEYQYIAFTNGSNGAIYLDEIDITWDAESAPAEQASKPVISLGADNKVTITAENADAIYYTIDGSDPSTSSSVYSAPFEISEKTTVKAIAVKAGMENSDIASAELTPSVAYANFAAVIAAAPAKTEVITVNGPITIIYNNGSNTYVKDNDGGYMLIYSTAKLISGVKNGDVLASITGAYSPYNSLPEIVPSAIGEITSGNAVDPEEVSFEEIGLDDANKYIKVSGVTIAATSTNNTYDFTDETTTVVGYNTFYNSSYYDVVEVPEGNNFTVTGFVCRKNKVLQVTPISIEGGEVVERCENPVFSVKEGSVVKGTQVEISCATEGASIFYTTDGTEPGASANLYSEAIAINESCTIKAIAIKEGNNDSDVVSASYSVLADGASLAQFDFSNPTSLNPAQEEATTVVSDVVFSNEGVNISFVKGGSVDHKIYKGTTSGVETIDLRLYAGTDESASTMTIAADNAKSIDKIEFSNFGGNSAYAMTPDSGTFTSSGSVATWVPSEDVASVVFTITATTRIATMDVIYTAGADGVNSVAVDSADSAVEYYNLQGVKVNNPANGLYIVKQGNKVSKQIIR